MLFSPLSALLSLAVAASVVSSTGLIAHGPHTNTHGRHLQVPVLDTDIVGDVDLINPGIDIDLEAGVGILAPSTCHHRGSLLSVGVGLSVEVGNLVDINVCVCLNALDIFPQCGFHPCPPCPKGKEPICGSGQCGCQCGAHAIPHGDECVCKPGYTMNKHGECVCTPSGSARRKQLAREARPASV